MTPDWLWSCAERWERVEERLYPLNSELVTVRRKPPAHCTSPDVAFQLAIAASGKDEQDAAAPVYDRITGKRIFRQTRRSDKGKTLATSRSSNVMSFNYNCAVQRITFYIPISQTQKRFSETVNPLLSLSMDEIADMDREVEDILQDTDGGETDEEELEESMPIDFPRAQGEEENENITGNFALLIKTLTIMLIRWFNITEASSKIEGYSEMNEAQQPTRKRKLEVADHNLIIGGVIDQDSPENDTLMERFRRGESIPVVDGDEPDDEDSNEPEIDELESDEEVEDSELCLAGQALEREFLSEED